MKQNQPSPLKSKNKQKLQSKKGFGDAGELYAANVLSSKGYKIIQTNYRCRYGEIDIIAIKENVLCFIEVKTRSSDRYGMPHEAVTPKKIERIRKTALFFCANHRSLPKKMKIEVVSLFAQAGKVVKMMIIGLE